MRINIVYDLAPYASLEIGHGIEQGLRTLGHDVTITPTYGYAASIAGAYTKEQLKVPEVMAPLRAITNLTVLGSVVNSSPEVVLVISGIGIAEVVVDKIRQVTGAKCVLYMTESPYLDDRLLELVDYYDMVLCNERSTMEKFQARHDNVIYFPHAFNPEVHYPREVKGRDDIPDVFMAGAGFSERIEILTAVNWKDLDVALWGRWDDAKGTNLEKYICGALLPNTDVAAYYSNAHININIHRSSQAWTEGVESQHITGADSIGPRVYQVLACGGFLLTDHRGELTDLFESGKDLVIFDGPDDLEQKVHYFIEHPEERQRIAAQGMVAVQKYSFAQRCEDILVPGLEVLKDATDRKVGCGSSLGRPHCHA